MASDRLLLRMIASAFLAGELSAEAILERSNELFGKPCPWLRPAVRRFLKIRTGTTPRQQDVFDFLRMDPGFWRAWSRNRHRLSIARWLMEPQPMRPVAAAANWELPEIVSVDALAAWLEMTVSELEWFADLRGFRDRQSLSPLGHYHYRILAKKSGNIRLIEAPKERLKKMQRQILSQMLNRIPPHPAVHGFVRGRSIQTFVAPHVAERVILKLDLKDFFPTFRAARIQTLFRTLGYPEPVADLLGGVCTNATPRQVWRTQPFDVNPVQWREARTLYTGPHLPQGAPTSPVLANVCCYRMDCRLTGLAHSAGATYSRYADDLAFSGAEEFERSVVRFSTHVAAILMEEGFVVNFRKTRVMGRGVRQRLVGLVVNERANVAGAGFDRLKAILTNCVRHGPASQNRDGHPQFRLHLEGRVKFVEAINPEKAYRLHRVLEKIRWE